MEGVLIAVALIELPPLCRPNAKKFKSQRKGENLELAENVDENASVEHGLAVNSCNLKTEKPE